MQKKIFIKTFGCQMNVYDSNRIYDSVKRIGFIKSQDQDNLDCYVINTCHIRDKAKEKVYHEVGRVKKIFRNKKKPLLIVAGCVAQAENEEMLKRESYIDIVIGPQSYHKINSLISNFSKDRKEITEFETRESEYNADSANRAIGNLRFERNIRLAETDFYALSDVTMSSDMTTYRQALRDLPSNYTTDDSKTLAEDLSNLNWPTKP